MKRDQNISQKEYHKKYMMEKVPCACGTVTARNNMSHHRKTKKHQEWLSVEREKKEIFDAEELKQEIEVLKKQIKKIKKLLLLERQYQETG